MKLGVTMLIGNPQNHEYFRCEVGLEGIDTEQPIEAQLGKTGNVMEETYGHLMEALQGIIEQNIAAGKIR